MRSERLPPARLARLALVSAPILFLAVMAWSRRWVAEDAFIDFRVARNLAAGAGPVFNVDERVEAYTNPLWVALLTPLQALGVRIEPASVFLSLILALTGVALGIAAAARLDPRREVTLLPLGAIVFVAVSAVWDFSTSGLETGLALTWMGGSYALLTRRGSATTAAGTLPAALWIGLGPLVRPDLGVFAIAFLAALALVSPGRATLRRLLAVAAAALFVPAAYAIFRMGYFAALVPNTAIAKEAGQANWSQGFAYLADFIGTYHLWVPGLTLGGLALARLAARARGRDARAAIVLAAPLAAACAHALFVTRVGGDFMHARLLLPSFFGALLPVMALRPPERSASRNASIAFGVAAGVAAGWALAAMAMFRTGEIEAPTGITDERRWYVDCSSRAHPILAEDLEGCGYVEAVRRVQLQRAQDRSRTVLIDQQNDYFEPAPDPLPVHAYPVGEHVDPRIQFVVGRPNVGVNGWLFGSEVHLVDRFGLSDPIAARLRIASRRRPGHEKNLFNAWIVARYAAPDADADPAVADARAALACGDLAQLLDAVGQPLTLRRFARNVMLAPRLAALRIPPDPRAARDALCGPGPDAGI